MDNNHRGLSSLSVLKYKGKPEEFRYKFHPHLESVIRLFADCVLFDNFILHSLFQFQSIICGSFTSNVLSLSFEEGKMGIVLRYAYILR